SCRCRSTPARRSATSSTSRRRRSTSGWSACEPSEPPSEGTMSPLLGIDPLLNDGLLWTPLVIILIKVVVVFVIGLVGTMFMVWFERKIIAGMQNRVGPNKAGPFGILQTLADGMKLIFKEDFMPDRADRWVYRLAPFLAFVPAFLVWSVIPLGGDF